MYFVFEKQKGGIGRQVEKTIHYFILKILFIIVIVLYGIELIVLAGESIFKVFLLRGVLK